MIVSVVDALLGLSEAQISAEIGVLSVPAGWLVFYLHRSKPSRERSFSKCTAGLRSTDMFNAFGQAAQPLQSHIFLLALAFWPEAGRGWSWSERIDYPARES